MLDTLQEIYGAIMRNKMRTVATGFAVASGLFLIIVLQGAGNGIIHSFEADMEQCTRLTLAQWKKRPIMQKALESMVRLISPIL